MLCTFQIDAGALIVQSEDIKAIEDVEIPNDMEGVWAKLTWMIGDSRFDVAIKGTALENMARIQQEELDLVARVEGHRQMLAARMQAGYPAQPVKRGKS